MDVCLETCRVEKDCILWVKNLGNPALVGAATVMLIVEDRCGDVISLPLNNQVSKGTTYDEVLKMFPKGIQLGIKQPYLKILFVGNVTLRNDNPQNVVFKKEIDSIDSDEQISVSSQQFKD